MMQQKCCEKRTPDAQAPPTFSPSLPPGHFSTHSPGKKMGIRPIFLVLLVIFVTFVNSVNVDDYDYESEAQRVRRGCTEKEREESKECYDLTRKNCKGWGFLSCLLCYPYLDCFADKDRDCYFNLGIFDRTNSTEKDLCEVIHYLYYYAPDDCAKKLHAKKSECFRRLDQQIANCETVFGEDNCLPELVKTTCGEDTWETLKMKIIDFANRHANCTFDPKDY